MSFPVVQLGELCELDRQSISPNDPTARSLPFVGVENVEPDNGALNFESDSRVGNQRSATFRFDERHVLYAKLRPYLNKVATPDFSGRCSTELVPLLPRNGIDRQFIAHLLRRKETVEFVMTSVTGSRMPRTDMKTLMSLPVPLPPLEEQLRIISILSRTAKIERLRAQAQKCLREFIPALFVEMFGDPATNPKDWPMSRLGDVCSMDRRGLHPDDPVAPDLPFVGLEHIESASGKFEFDRYSRAGSQRSTTFLFDERHILYAKLRPYLNKVAIPTFEGRCSTELIPLLPRKGVDREFIALLLRNQNTVNYLMASVTGARMPRTDMTMLMSLPVPVPPLDKQRRFTEIVRRADALESRTSETASRVTTLTASLMSQLLAQRA